MRWAPAQESQAVEWRPRGGGVAGDGGGVEDPDRASLSPVGEGDVEQVVLDAGGDDRSLPFEEGGDGEAGGLAAAGGADDGEAGLGFGGEETAAEMAEGDAALLGVVDGEVAEVSRGGQATWTCDAERVVSLAPSGGPDPVGACEEREDAEGDGAGAGPVGDGSGERRSGVVGPGGGG